MSTTICDNSQPRNLLSKNISDPLLKPIMRASRCLKYQAERVRIARQTKVSDSAYYYYLLRHSVAWPTQPCLLINQTYLLTVKIIHDYCLELVCYVLASIGTVFVTGDYHFVSQSHDFSHLYVLDLPYQPQSAIILNQGIC